MFGFGRKKETLTASGASFAADFDEQAYQDTTPAMRATTIDMTDELTRLKFWESNCVEEMERLGMRKQLSAPEFNAVLNQQRALMEEQWMIESAPWMAKQRTEAKAIKRDKGQTDQMRQMQGIVDQLAALTEQVHHSGLGARAVDAAVAHPFIAGFMGAAAGPAIIKKLTGR